MSLAMQVVNRVQRNTSQFSSQGLARRIETGVNGAHVYALAVSDATDRVAISIGPEVHIAHRLADGMCIVIV
jgi:hypothetical protein